MEIKPKVNYIFVITCYGLFSNAVVNLGSSVGIVINPRAGMSRVWTSLEPTQPSIQLVRVFFPADKPAGVGSCPLTSSSEVNGWNYTSTRPIRLRGICKNNFTPVSS
jgi:hypothetical protein